MMTNAFTGKLADFRRQTTKAVLPKPKAWRKEQASMFQELSQYAETLSASKGHLLNKEVKLFQEGRSPTEAGVLSALKDVDPGDKLGYQEKLRTIFGLPSVPPTPTKPDKMTTPATKAESAPASDDAGSPQDDDSDGDSDDDSSEDAQGDSGDDSSDDSGDDSSDDSDDSQDDDSDKDETLKATPRKKHVKMPVVPPSGKPSSPSPATAAPRKENHEIVELAAEKIDQGADTSVRASLNEEAVAEYAEIYAKDADKLPPPVCMMLPDARILLIEGGHRLAAWKKARPGKKIKVKLFYGILAEAQWKAAASNQEHGVRRTSADKRLAIRLALKAKSGSSDRDIADHIGVDHKTVEATRSEMESTGEIPQSEKRKGKDGRIRPSHAGKPLPKPSAFPPTPAPQEPPPQKPPEKDESRDSNAVKGTPPDESTHAEELLSSDNGSFEEPSKNVSTPVDFLKAVWSHVPEDKRSELLALLPDESRGNIRTILS